MRQRWEKKMKGGKRKRSRFRGMGNIKVRLLKLGEGANIQEKE